MDEDESIDTFRVEYSTCLFQVAQVAAVVVQTDEIAVGGSAVMNTVRSWCYKAYGAKAR
jgi:hypothetical protein